MRLFRQSNLGDELYLDPAIYRGLAAEHPVGNPFGGPAYGEKAMPVVAVAAAAATFATGAGIAMAAGATLGAMVAGGAMMVGAAMTIVGTVTGRPNLVKWGGIISLAGGIGAGILSSTGGLTEAAEVVQLSGPGASTEAASTVTINPDSAGPGPLNTVPAETAPAAVDTVATPAQPTTGPVDSGAPPAPGAETAPVQPSTELAPTDPVAPDGATPSATPDGGKNAFSPGDKPAFTESEGMNPADARDAFDPTTQQTTASPTAPQGPTAPGTAPVQAANPNEPSWWEKAGKWVKNNKELAQMGTQGIAGLLGAVQKPQTPYQMALERQARLQADRMDTKSPWWRKSPGRT